MSNLFWLSKNIYIYLKRKHLRVLSFVFIIVCKIINRINNSGIPVNEKINKFNSPHGFSGIYISKEAEIGKNCTIYHQVTIGFNDITTSKNYGAPIIGDNVYIGAGAKIIGKITIGNNVKIGANCVVAENIDDNSTVVMPHPRIIKREGKK